MSEISSPYPIVKTNKGDGILLIYDTGKGYRCLGFTKEEAIKFYASTKKQLEKNSPTCELIGNDDLTGKISIKEKSELVKPWIDMFKTELMYITGKMERPKRVYSDPTQIVETKEEKPKEIKKLTDKEKEKAIRTRKKK